MNKGEGSRLGKGIAAKRVGMKPIFHAEYSWQNIGNLIPRKGPPREKYICLR